MKKHPETSEEAARLLRKAYSLSSQEETRSLYRQWAQTYDHTMLVELGYLTPARTARLLAEHLADKNPVILDVGSGTGLAGVELAGLGFATIDALDYSPEMLAVADHRNVYRACIEADLNKPLAMTDHAYDALICTGTFTHAHVGAACLDELFRIMKPGGVFACTVHKDVWQPSGFATITAALEKAGTLKTLHRQMGTYYTKSTEPEGWYIVWQKTG
jgi:predicted TPR repeat methyltransferase